MLQSNTALVDFAAVNQAVLDRLPDILARWLPGGRIEGREYVVRNPKRRDQHPGSFKINIDTGRWADFATGDRGGDPISLAAYLAGCSQIDAARQLAVMLGLAPMPENGMFTPLPGLGQRRRSAAPKADEWRPILPVPEDAPAGPPLHKRRGKPAGCWPYRDLAGKLLGYVMRYNLADGGKEFLPATFCQHPATGAREWRFKSWLAPRPLYGLDRLTARPKAPVMVCEGEKAADAAAELLPDHVAVTSSNGAKSATKADWRVLAGRDVTIWPDNDDEGRSYAAAVVKALRGIARSVKIVSPPQGAPERWDAADALADNWDRTKAAALIAGAALAEPGTAAPAQSGGRGSRRRQSDDLLDFLPDVELWHSPDREAFATVKVGGHFENCPVRSKDFREFLSGRYFAVTGAAPGSQAMEDALRVYEGHAKHHGPEHQVSLRIGERDGAVYIDLGDAEWRAIEATAQGWRVLDRAPVKFVRPPAMRALPIPEAGGMIEQELRDLVNVRDDADFVLIVVYVVGCYNPRGPSPILAVNGEQGSAKSTLCRLLRALTDPNAAPIRLPPRNEDDLIVAARNSRVLAFDNLSDVPGWLSDALCSLATGAGVSTREHYSNTSEVVFEGARPIMMNGIPDLGSRPDFADRIIHVVLKPIPETERRSEADYWREVETRLPLILGAILNAVVCALRHRDTALPPVTVPPLAEQQAVAGLLGALDDKIELNRRMAETLEGMARALFRSWFVDFDPVRAKAEGRPTGLPDDLTALFPDRFGEEDFPLGWEPASIDVLAEVNPSTSLKAGSMAPYVDMAALPTRLARIESWIERPAGSGARFKNRDTLIARITPCLENGKTAIVDFLPEGQVGWGSTEFIVLRPRPGVPAGLLYLLARYEPFRSHLIGAMTGTSGRQRVPPSALAAWKMANPPQPVLSAFGEIVAPFFERIRAADAENRTLASLRDILLPKLISGELRVAEAEKRVAAAG